MCDQWTIEPSDTSFFCLFVCFGVSSFLPYRLNTWTRRQTQTGESLIRKQWFSSSENDSGSSLNYRRELKQNDVLNRPETLNDNDSSQIFSKHLKRMKIWEKSSGNSRNDNHSSQMSRKFIKRKELDQSFGNTWNDNDTPQMSRKHLKRKEWDQISGNS